MQDKISVTTISDILSVIGRAGKPDIQVADDGSVTARVFPYIIKLSRHAPIFQWSISSVDDPSEKSDGYASNPTDAIIDFMKGHDEEDEEDGFGSETVEEFFGKYASMNSVVLLKKLSELIEKGSISPRVATRILRRISTQSYLTPELLDLHHRYLDDLKKYMEKNNWNVYEDDEFEVPILRFEIGDEYEGKIRLDDIIYDYSFSIEGYPDLKIDRTDNDPKRALHDWANEDRVSSAVVEARKNERAHTGQKPAIPEQSAETVKPSRK